MRSRKLRASTGTKFSITFAIARARWFLVSIWRTNDRTWIKRVAVVASSGVEIRCKILSYSSFLAERRRLTTCEASWANSSEWRVCPTERAVVQRSEGTEGGGVAGEEVGRAAGGRGGADRVEVLVRVIVVTEEVRDTGGRV